MFAEEEVVVLLQLGVEVVEDLPAGTVGEVFFVVAAGQEAEGLG